MKNKIVKFMPLVALFVLTGCNTQEINKKTTVDPFLIGDNLEAVNIDEARIVCTEANNNLQHISKLHKEIKTISDTTAFYVGALDREAEREEKVENYDVEYYKNVSNRKYSLVDTITNSHRGNSVERRQNEMTEWYNYKKGSEEVFSLYSKTTTTFNEISWDTYAITSDSFATNETLQPNWNKYLIKNATEFTDTPITFSMAKAYVKDGIHLIGYNISSVVTVEKSPIAPLKEDISITKRVDSRQVVAYLKNDAIGWIAESVANQEVVTYWNNLSGVAVDGIEVSRHESTLSLSYTAQHESHSVPKYKEDTSGENPLYISMFNSVTHEYESTVATFSDNDDYYRQIEAGYDGKAFSIERYLTEGIYSIYDKDHTLSFDESTYEVWGYSDIINNRCPSFIQDPEIDEHEHLFQVARAGVYSFEIVFDKNMENITTFTVAKMG